MSELLARFVPDVVKEWLCRVRPRGWPWWCDQELLEAELRAERRLRELRHDS